MCKPEQILQYALFVLVMEIEHLTGKEGRELAEHRKKKRAIYS